MAIVDDFLRSRAGRSPATLRDYRAKLSYLSRFCESIGRDISALTRRDLDGFVGWLRSRGLADASVVTITTAARSCIRWAVDAGQIGAECLRWRPCVSWRREVPKAVSSDDVDAMLAVAGRRDRLLVLLLRDTGARVGSVLALDTGDVDIARKRIIARRTKSLRPQVLYMTDRLADVLRARLAEGPGPLLRGGRGGRLTVSGARKALARLARRAGVTGYVNPHAFRHAFARDLIQSGCDLARVSRLMGHADVRVTAASYAVFDGLELQGAYDSFWSRRGDVGQTRLPENPGS